MPRERYVITPGQILYAHNANGHVERTITLRRLLLSPPAPLMLDCCLLPPRRRHAMPLFRRYDAYTMMMRHALLRIRILNNVTTLISLLRR